MKTKGKFDRSSRRSARRGPTATAQPVYQQIKLALNVHAGDFMVVRRVDGAKPQPPQKMTTERFLDRAAKQKAQAREVIYPVTTDTPSENVRPEGAGKDAERKLSAVRL